MSPRTVKKNMSPLSRFHSNACEHLPETSTSDQISSILVLLIGNYSYKAVGYIQRASGKDKIWWQSQLIVSPLRRACESQQQRCRAHTLGHVLLKGDEEHTAVHLPHPLFHYDTWLKGLIRPRRGSKPLENRDVKSTSKESNEVCCLHN